MLKNPKKDWWETYFNEQYLKTYADVGIISSFATLRQISFLRKVMGLKKGVSILDMACGYGRHAIPLAELGYRVTGGGLFGVFSQYGKKKSTSLPRKN